MILCFYLNNYCRNILYITLYFNTYILSTKNKNFIDTFIKNEKSIDLFFKH